MELWEECIAWLQAVGILSAEESSSDRVSRPADLAALLRDGVLLCELALSLSPECINRHEIFLQFCKSPFMCSSNTGLFLGACRNTFGLSSEELFADSDLYDLEDFGRVLRVLALLSQSRQAKQSHPQARPFPSTPITTALLQSPPGQRPSLRGLEEGGDEESTSAKAANTTRTIYCNLRGEVEERLAMSSSSREVSTTTPLPPSARRRRELSQLTSINAADLAECHYYDIVIGNFKQTERKREQIYDSILTQRPPTSTSRLLPKEYTEFKPSNLREHAIKELLDTENNYCDAICMIIERFYNKLNQRIPNEDMEAIFLNLRDIHKMHKGLLGKLVPAVTAALGLVDSIMNMESSSSLTSIFPIDLSAGIVQPSPQRLHPHRHDDIASVFTKNKLGFLRYAEYCSRLNSAIARIDNLERSQSELKTFIHELCTKANQNQFKLQDLLMLPMQRVLKYSLLLKQIMASSSDIAEQAALNEAVETMQDVSNYVNECKRDHEAVAIIERVQRGVTQPSYGIEQQQQQALESSMLVGKSLGGGGERRSLDSANPHYQHCDFIDYGRLLHDGAVRLVDPDEGSSRQKPRYLFLFEKMLLVCKKRGERLYDLKRAHIVSEFELWENELETGNGAGGGGGTNTLPSFTTTNSVSASTPSSTLRTSTLSRKLTATLFDNTTVTLVRRGSNRGSNNENSIQIVTKSMAQKSEWRLRLRNAIEINQPSKARAKGHSLLYKTYKSATSCSICGKLLAGQFYQGYHCSGCNLDMHRDCTGLRNCTLTSTTTTMSGTPKPVPAARTRRQMSATSHSNGQCRERDRASFKNAYIGHPPRPISVPPILQHQPSLPSTAPSLPSLLNNLDRSPNPFASLTSPLHRRSARHSISSLNSLPPDSPTNGDGNGNGSFIMASKLLRPPAPLISVSIVSEYEEAPSDGVDIELAPWYFGELGRAEANERLGGSEQGTFLVRLSAKQQQYVVSLSYDGAVKHMKLEKSPTDEKFYLHDGRVFDSIRELIVYYRHNSLAEGFLNLNTCLRGTPLKGSIYRAMHDYQPRNIDDPKYLMLCAGDVVTVLDCSGEANGWWKGKVNERIGFFPITYVKRVRQPDEDGEGIIAASCSLNPGVHSSPAILTTTHPTETLSRRASETRTTVIAPAELETESMQRNYYSSHFPVTTSRPTLNGSVISSSSS